MKVKISEASGVVLDWLVAKADGWTEDCNSWLYEATLQEIEEGPYHPSTDWAQGGPIIEREHLCVGYKYQCDPSYVPLLDPSTMCWARTTAGGHLMCGPTPLTAAMRCFVASKLGDEVEVPDELGGVS